MPAGFVSGWLQVLLALVFWCAPSWAGPIDAIDHTVASEMRRQHSPAVAIAVAKDGRVLKARGYGLANLEHRVPATSTTFFQTASMGKQFLAALVMLLVRDGKLKLDEPVASYLPEAQAAWPGITVRHLLTHTAGLPPMDGRSDLRKDYGEEERLASAIRVPLIAAPGEKHAYSNLGYQVLGILCSRVGGRFYGDQMRDRLFRPAGMQSRIISERDIVPGRAGGYLRYEGTFENQEWVAPSQNTTGDGSLYVSARDMARWSIVLDGRRLLSDAEKQALWTPATLAGGQPVDYGLGWKLLSQAGHRQVRHRGDWQGFTSHILHMPDDRLTISVLMNRAYGQPHVIADRIAALYLPALRKAPEPSPTLRTLAGTPMFVRGQVNDWKPTALLAEAAPGLLQARLQLPAGMQSFKIGDADWRLGDLGARFDEALVKAGRAQPLEHRGEDLFLQVPEPGEYLFQLDLRGGKAAVLTVFPPAAGEKR